MNVSVVIPAYNAEETLAATLDSLCAQSHQQWEAFVVDDGSTDGTASIAQTYAQSDPRLRLISQTHQGACAARNKGLYLAKYDWLLFLDADDLLLPNHLERMTAAVEQDPHLDAVHCDWQRVTLDGQILPGDPYRPRGDLFALLARRPLFPPFACMLRRTLVLEAGAWDTSFDACQDWDLFQRCARTGARFGAVDEVLGYYRARPGSLSTGAPLQLLRDGLRVIENGFGVDRRVRHPAPAHVAGLDTPDQPNAQLIWLSWCAGLALGLAQDTSALLQSVQNAHDPALDPHTVADCIFRAAHLALGQPPEVWLQLWPQREQEIADFLRALETQARAPDLAERTMAPLTRLVVENVKVARPLTIGQMCAIQVDAAQSLPHLTFQTCVNSLGCEASYAGHKLGFIQIPLSHASLAPDALADAIARAFAWPILGRFFEQSIYPQLRFEKSDDALSLWRGALCLAQNLPVAEKPSWSELHDDVGWAIFLQEVWGKPDWPQERFYDPHYVEPSPTTRIFAATPALSVEVGDSLPHVVTEYRRLELTLTVGGAPLGGTSVPVTHNKLTAQEIRVALTTMAEFELCRLAVRQALVGRPLSDPHPLRHRLQQAAAGTAGRG